MSKIIITETIFRDGECPLCFDCQMPAVGMQIKCNCGCDEIWCQPCYYKHYGDFVISINLNKFVNGDDEIGEKLTEALANK